MNKEVHVVNEKEEYDAVVVGSGMTGGWAAKELCEKGLSTLVLERGRMVEHGDYPTEHQRDWEFPLRDRRLTPEQVGERYPVQSRTAQFREATKHFFIEDQEYPYIEEKPFTWIQGNQVGGRSLLWGRHCYRWSNLDFEANARDGHGVDWPIRYEDIAPWYDYVERFMGISGEKLGLPHVPDGQFLPPMELNAGEKFVRKGIEEAYPNRVMTIGRCAVLTQNHNGRAACHYCGPCFRGCSTGSYFSTQSATLPAARKTGNLTLSPHSLVHSVIYDREEERAKGVRYIDTETGKAREVYGRLVFMCASTLGTTKILLNSTSRRFPNGLANSSGVLGHYLMDHHFMVGARGSIPGLRDRYYKGDRPTSAYVPRFRNLEGPSSDNLDFVRGYACQGGASRAGWNRGGNEAGIGKDLKSRMHEPGGWNAGLLAFGECLPRYENHVELAEETNQYGIPLLRISCDWGENELEMRKDMAKQTAAMLEAAGCESVETFDALQQEGYGAEPGLGIHEMGTARMGRDPSTSVLNRWNQAHDVENLFVTDGACMTSSACQNPSITYVALTARACDYAVKQMKKGNI